MNRVRAAVGVLGELLVTAGLVVLLFLAWELGWNDFFDGRAQRSVVAGVQQAFAAGGTTTDVPMISPDATPPADSIFALLRIPRLGTADNAVPVYEGTNLAVLAKGVGHYPGTALPGQVGNMGIAGHRVTHAHPFFDIDTIQPGDAIVVETREAFVVYRAVRSTVVRPTEVDVVAPVPQQPQAVPTEAWLTLTSCNPKFSARERWVLFARLDQVYPRAGGIPATVLADPRAG